MKKRILSAIVLLMIGLPLLIIGSWPFAILVAFAAELSLYELLKAREKKNKIPKEIKGIGYILLLLIVFSSFDNKNNFYAIDYRFLILTVLGCFLPLIFIGDGRKYQLSDCFYLFGSILLIGFAYNIIIGIRNIDITYIVYLLLITMVTDTFAYIIGGYIGKHKLIESISPNKTMEGLIGGVAMGTFVASVFYMEAVDPNIPLVSLVLATLSLTLIGQLGDLVFSFIKRQFDIKDFSKIIPGHGGILDRMDSLIFVSMSFMLYLGTIL